MNCFALTNQDVKVSESVLSTRICIYGLVVTVMPFLPVIAYIDFQCFVQYEHMFKKALKPFQLLSRPVHVDFISNV